MKNPVAVLVKGVAGVVVVKRGVQKIENITFMAAFMTLSSKANLLQQFTRFIY